MKELMIKHKKGVAVVLVLCIYFALLSLVSFARAPVQYQSTSEQLLTYSDLSVSIGENEAFVSDAFLAFNSRNSGAKAFSAWISLLGVENIWVEFTVDCPEEYQGSILHVDLCADGYDNPEQEFEVALVPGENRIAGVLHKGDHAPEKAQFRVFTLDPGVYIIEDLFVCNAIKSNRMMAGVIVVTALFIILSVSVAVWYSNEGYKRSNSEKISWGLKSLNSNSGSSEPENEVVPVVERHVLRFRWVLLLFLLCTVFHFLIQMYPKRLQVYPDEAYYYYKTAQNLCRDGLSGLRDAPMSNILYPFFIAPFFLIKNTSVRITFLEIFNCCAVSTVVFPTYLLSKKYLKTVRSQLILLCIAVTLPDLMFAGTFMSEVIFYPLEMWGIYFVWGLIGEKDGKRRRKLAIFTGLFVYFLYLCKAVALAILLTLIIYFVCEGIFKRNAIKENLVCAVLMLGSFVLVKLLMDSTALSYIPKNYYSNVIRTSIELLSDGYNWLFLGYSILYNILGTLLGFFLFPIVVPALNFKQLEDGVKGRYLFLVLSTIINIGIISFSISVRENLGEESIRIHLRYFSALAIPYLSIFFECMENRKHFALTERKKLHLVGTCVLLCTLFITVFHGVGLSYVDCHLLHYYCHDIYRSGKILSAGAGEVAFNMQIILAKIVIVSGFLLGIFFLYRTKRAKIVIPFGIAFIIVNMANNWATNDFYRAEYKISEKQVEQVRLLQNYVGDADENVLFIAETFKNMGIVDKYMPSTIQTLFLESVNVNSDDSKYPVREFGSPDTEYVITDGSLILRGDGTTEIFVDGIEDYLIYRCTTPNFQYYTRDIFPKDPGMSFEVAPKSPIFHTRHQIGQDRGFVSVTTNSSDALIYGPYSDIYAGTYQIDFFYSLSEEMASNEIGTIDINIPELGGVLATQTVDANSEVATLTFTVNSDAKMAETRFFTDQPGIVVTKIVITHLDEE